MKFEEFKPGVFRQQFEYRSFSPVPVNVQWSWEDPRIATLLERATRKLGELNSFSLILPDVDLFIRMHVAKEASASSRIEGTQTTMEEAVLPREQIAPERRDDWQEVQNYIEALNHSVEALKTLPLSNRLLKQAHQNLLQGVRGEHKTPGEFRRTQNWIGGTSLGDAAFIPPAPNEVPELMSDLEKFWHNRIISVPQLVRVAISHYQFETIHPFLDGNGRIGRLLIPLYLVSNGLLSRPTLCVSAHLERNRDAYYDALMRVRLAGDLVHWVLFLLTAILETATKGQVVLQQILALRTEADTKIASLGRRLPNAQRILNLFYSQPILSPTEASITTGMSYPTARAIMQDMVQLGLLVETDRPIRGYSFKRYTDLFRFDE